MCTGYLGAAQLQTLDQSVPTLGEVVEPGLQFAGHLLVLDAGQQVLAHGAQLVHGGALHLQLRLHRLVAHKHIHTQTRTLLRVRSFYLGGTEAGGLQKDTHGKAAEAGHHLCLVLQVGGLDGANQLLLLSQPGVK